jgi:MFS family permease
MANGPQQTAGSAFSSKQIFMAISAVFIGYFINAYFTQALGNAAPKIAATFEKGVELLAWSISIPSLGMAVATLLGGKLSDIFGRRALLVSALVLILAGSVLCILSASFTFFIFARTIQSLGVGIIAPLCYTVIGDIFSSAAQRGKWIGLLNLPMGIGLIGLIVSPLFIDTFRNWQLIFWCSLPLAIVGLIFAFRMPALMQDATTKIDVPGAILITLASSAIILGLSLPGTKLESGTVLTWGSWQIIGLLGAAVVLGVLFLLAESKAKEPFLYVELLKNRTFMTISIAGFLSFFGMMSIGLYYQIFLQGVQNRPTMDSAWIGQFPVSVLMAFIGIPTGFLIAKTQRYKSLFIAGYGLAAVAMMAMYFFSIATPAFLETSVALMAGLGLGVIPTINTLLIGAAVPRKLMGSAMAVLFFSISIGMAIAVAIQGTAMNARYSNDLNAALPEVVKNNKDVMALTGDYRALLSKETREKLESITSQISSDVPALPEKTISAVRSSTEDALKIVFLIGGVTMALSFLLILTVPVIPMDRPVEEAKASEPVAA